MIVQIPKTFRLTKDEKQFIKSLPKLEGYLWDKPGKNLKKRSKERIERQDKIKALKKRILKKLQESHAQEFQGQKITHCAYCGLVLNLTSSEEIEHFLPKAKYPSEIFTPINLFLACDKCNKPGRKGNSTILKGVHNKNYRKNTFEIVHPLSDPVTHYHFVEPSNRIFIDESKSSPEGKKSIEMFDLNKREMIMARASWYKCKDDFIDPKFANLVADSTGIKRTRK